MRKLLLLGLVIFGSGAAEGISKGEFDCWEAVSHLIDCCPGHSFDYVDCTTDRGCGTKVPDLDDSTSQCLTALSCHEIVLRGICDSVSWAAVPTPPSMSVCQ